MRATKVKCKVAIKVTDEDLARIAFEIGQLIASVYAMKQIKASREKGFSDDAIEVFVKRFPISVDKGIDQFYDDITASGFCSIKQMLNATKVKLTKKQEAMFRKERYASFIENLTKMRHYGVFNHHHAQIVEMVETWGFPIMQGVKK